VEAVKLFGSPKEEWKSGFAILCDDCFCEWKEKMFAVLRDDERGGIRT